MGLYRRTKRVSALRRWCNSILSLALRRAYRLTTTVCVCCAAKPVPAGDVGGSCGEKLPSSRSARRAHAADAKHSQVNLAWKKETLSVGSYPASRNWRAPNGSGKTKTLLRQSADLLP